MTQLHTETPSRLALLNSCGPKLADQYADTLAIGWRHRVNRLNSPAATFADLFEADGRMQAALDALVFLKRHAEAHMRAMLQDPVRRGELFAIALYALASANQSLLDTCLDLTIARPDLHDAMGDACIWAPAAPILRATIERLPAKVRMDVASSRFREYPGLAEETLLWLKSVDPAPDNVVGLCRLLRRMGRNDLAPALGRYFVHDDAEVRAVAASAALAMSGDKPVSGASTTLADLVDSPDAKVREIAVHYAILFDAKHANDVLTALAKDKKATRLYLRALGWAGKVDAISSLIDYCGSDDYRRLAGASLALITGSDPIRDGWRGVSPETVNSDDGEDTIASNDPDTGLLWPDGAAFSRWWNVAKDRFGSHYRYVGGQPITSGWLAAILTGGPLAWRQLAADYLQHATARPVFPTHLRAADQCVLFTEFA
jgi:uncharacterized protein (TIGR02270 family)